MKNVFEINMFEKDFTNQGSFEFDTINAGYVSKENMISRKSFSSHRDDITDRLKIRRGETYLSYHSSLFSGSENESKLEIRYLNSENYLVTIDPWFALQMRSTNDYTLRGLYGIARRLYKYYFRCYKNVDEFDADLYQFTVYQTDSAEEIEIVNAGNQYPSDMIYGVLNRSQLLSFLDEFRIHVELPS